MMWTKLILVIVSLFSDADPQFVYESEKINKHFISLMNKKYGIELIGYGGGSYPEIRGANLILEKKETLSKDEARRLIIELYNNYITLLNSEKKLRPYFQTYPLDGEGVSFYVYFGPNSYPKLGAVSINAHRITYITMLNKNWCAPQSSVEETETLAEARALLCQDSATTHLNQ